MVNWIGGALELAAWAYVALAVGALILALRQPPTPFRKGLAVLSVMVILGYLPFQALREYRRAKVSYEEHLVRSAQAQQRWRELCKAASEKVYRTIEGVEGVAWLKWRDETPNHGDQFKLDDPYGADCHGESCILTLLRATKHLELDPQRKLPYYKGYHYVEAIDPRNGIRYRYTLSLVRPNERDPRMPPDRVDARLDREEIAHATARYGVTWDDISTHKDRERWIAGGSLKVVDLQTNEVLAERIGYMVDREQGNTAGGRSPWLFAPSTACPPFPQASGGGPFMWGRTRDFALQALRPIQRD